MADGDLHNLSELLEELEKSSINTSQGSFVKMEDVRRLIDKRTTAQQEAAGSAPTPKTVEEARAAIKRDPELLKAFASAPQEPGRAIAAQEPQSSSRT